jgi:hypothetical protein
MMGRLESKPDLIYPVHECRLELCGIWVYTMSTEGIK